MTDCDSKLPNEYVIKMVGIKMTSRVVADSNYLDGNFVTFILNDEVVMRVNSAKIVFVKKL